MKSHELQVSQDDDQDKVSLLRYGDRERATREELFQKVWAQPVSIVAKEYQISDNALRKRFIHLNVPLPERGYWARLRAGKTVQKPQLPELELPKLQKPKTGDCRKLHLNSPALLFMKKRDREEILTLASTLRVGGPNSQMLESIRQMEIRCKEWNNPKTQESAGGYYIPRYRGSGDPPYLADAVSPKSYSRAFHLIDALLRALLSYEGSLEYDHSLRVNGESVSFAITEEKDNPVHFVVPRMKDWYLRNKREKITKIFCKARILLNKKSVFFKNGLTNDSERCMLCLESVHCSLSCGKEDAHGA